LTENRRRRGPGGMSNIIEVQWWENGLLKYVKAKPKATSRGNLRVDMGGRILVFKTLIEPCDVVEPQNGWVKVGRVTRFGEVVLGEGRSSREIEEERTMDSKPTLLIREVW